MSFCLDVVRCVWNTHFKGWVSTLLFFFVLAGCNEQEHKDDVVTDSFGADVEFLESYTDIIVLSSPDGKGQVAVAPSLQGRVMTSTAAGEEGRSYGWINRSLFASRDTMDHINAFGGEERFWMGPEGGQFSLYHGQGGDFSLDNWYVPKLLDLEPFEVTDQSINQVSVAKSAILENYSGTEFRFQIHRTIEVLSLTTVYNKLNIEVPGNLQTVAYQTTNILTNTGAMAWDKATGMPSIWLLGMFNASPQTTVVIPYIKGAESILGPIVVDTYFGKVPADRLKIGDGVLYFKGDANYRSKIGLTPARAKNILGSYDSQHKILTLIEYNKPAEDLPYVNSMWELQEDPYVGDVINSYNDGPPDINTEQLGSFFELETSSPAAALMPTQSISHIQLTYHFEGDEPALNVLAMQVLGVTLEQIQKAFD